MMQIFDFIKKIFTQIDPRYLVLSNHTILVVTAMLFLELRRTGEQIFFALAVAIITELLLSKLTSKQKSFNVKDRVLSAAVLALGTLVLIRSSYWWFYGFISFIGVLSKYVFVNDQGRHIFNPTNVAIVFSIIVLPEFLNVRVDSFSTHIFSLCCILFFGIWATVRANSWRISLGFYGGICLIGLPAAYILGYPPLLVLGPEINAGVILFAFLMMTDPQTSPRDKHKQWIFGFTIAAVDLLLRYNQLYYASFISLFIVTSFAIFLYRSPGLPKKVEA